jgi:NAD(P)-dependent dehydrogenase (short-subunit alcohol dehydrogenase family)
MIAEGFVANGCTVYVAARDASALESTAAELTAAGPGRCVPLAASLGNRDGCEALAAEIGQREPNGLNVLINNSGTSWGEPLDRVSGRMNWGWDKVLDLNVKAPFYLTRALLPSLRMAAADEDPARVIMIGSVVGITPQEVPTHAYDASKAALHSLTRKLAFELGPRAAFPDGTQPTGADADAAGRVTVNAIAPGFVPTRMTQGLSTWGASQETTAAATPLGRMGQPSDMAGAALFLASPAASWVTGVILPVDGGILSQPISIGVDD